jgi:hypothetical protein
LAQIPSGDRLVEKIPDQDCGNNRQCRDDNDGRQDSKEATSIRAAIAPYAAQKVTIDVGAILLFVVFEVAPPTATVKDLSSP